MEPNGLCCLLLGVGFVPSQVTLRDASLPNRPGMLPSPKRARDPPTLPSSLQLESSLPQYILAPFCWIVNSISRWRLFLPWHLRMQTYALYILRLSCCTASLTIEIRIYYYFICAPPFSRAGPLAVPGFTARWFVHAQSQFRLLSAACYSPQLAIANDSLGL